MCNRLCCSHWHSSVMVLFRTNGNFTPPTSLKFLDMWLQKFVSTWIIGAVYPFDMRIYPLQVIILLLELTFKKASQRLAWLIILEVGEFKKQFQKHPSGYFVMPLFHAVKACLLGSSVLVITLCLNTLQLWAMRGNRVCSLGQC